MAKHARKDSDEVRTDKEVSGAAEAGSAEGRSSSAGGRHAGGFGYKGDNEDEYPDALEALEPQDQPSILYDEEPLAVESEEQLGRHGKKSKKDKKKEDIPPYQRKSRRMRKILIAVIVLVILILIALGVLTYAWMQESRNIAVQQVQSQAESELEESLSGDVSDESDSTEKVTDVPDLVSLLGMTQDEVVEAVGSGATVTRESEVNEEGNPVKTSVTIALTDEPADSRSGTPSVYLGLDEDGAVVKAGYSVATSSLGYGSLSFADAVETEHIIEETLAEAGVDIDSDDVELPEDRDSYTSYDSDGTTVTKESCTFSGTAEIDGEEHEWSAQLLYDYTTANSSGNLADTLRYVYVYLYA